MNLQDRMRQLGEISSQSTIALGNKEFTPKTYYADIEEKNIFIDTLDSLINTITEFSVRTMVIQNNRISEITYLTSKRIDKQVQLSLEKINDDLKKLKTDSSGYYRFQYGKDISIEYYYPPITEKPFISITNNHVEMYNKTAFENIKESMEDGRNIILCGNVDFDAVATLLEFHFANEQTIVVNSNRFSHSRSMHFIPSREQESFIYQTIYNRADYDYVIINNPQDIKGFLRLCNNRGRVLAFIPEITGQEAVAVIEPYLNTDYLKACFTEKLDGLYVLRKNGTEMKCSRHSVLSPISPNGKKILSSTFNPNALDEGKIYFL